MVINRAGQAWEYGSQREKFIVLVVQSKVHPTMEACCIHSVIMLHSPFPRTFLVPAVKLLELTYKEWDMEPAFSRIV